MEYAHCIARCLNEPFRGWFCHLETWQTVPHASLNYMQSTVKILSEVFCVKVFKSDIIHHASFMIDSLMIITLTIQLHRNKILYNGIRSLHCKMFEKTAGLSFWSLKQPDVYSSSPESAYLCLRYFFYVSLFYTSNE